MSEIHGSRGVLPQSLHQDVGSSPVGSDKGAIGSRQVGKDVGVRLEAPPQNPLAKGQDLGQRQVQKHQGPVDLGLRSEARYRALPSKDQLIAKAGRPKDDISFGVFGTKKMSTRYKAVLGGLENYNHALGSDTQVGKPQVRQLRDHLATLKQATSDYGTSKKHSHKSEMEDLGRQIRREEKLLKSVAEQLDFGASWPAGVSLKEGLHFIRQGVQVADLAATLAQDLENAGMPPGELKPYRDAGFNGSEARLLKESGLGLAGGMKYREANLRVTPETLTGGFTSAHEKGFSELGSGAMNTVYKVTYETLAGDKVGVFKPLPDIDASKVEHGWVAEKTGVDKYNPQTAMRNLATLSVAKELGFAVVPETRLAEHGGKLGLLMDEAKGDLGYQTDKALFKDPQVRQQLTRLQLLDALVGQGDRHSKNYFIHKSETGQVTVTGIDNDQCFGDRLHDPNGIAYGQSDDKKGFRGVTLPPVIDRDTAQAIRNLTPQKLGELLGGKLRPSELTSARERLEGIKQHLNTLEGTGKFINADQWGSDEVSDLLTQENSYVGRDSYVPPRDPNQTFMDKLEGALLL